MCEMVKRVNRREFVGMAAAFATAGCTGVPAAGSAARWTPKGPAGRKVRVVMWGMCHEHAAGKFESLKKLPNDFELVGIVDDRASKTARFPRDFKRYDGIKRITEEEVLSDKSIDAVFVEVTNDDLVDIGMKCA